MLPVASNRKEWLRTTASLALQPAGYPVDFILQPTYQRLARGSPPVQWFCGIPNGLP